MGSGSSERDGSAGDVVEGPRLVVGDDGSAAADVVWLWVADHPWPGWRVDVVTAEPPPVGPPVPPGRAELHPWEPPSPRALPGTDVPVRHLRAEADPRLVLDACRDAALLAIGPRGAGVLKRLHLGSTAEWLVSARRPLVPLVVVRSARRTRTVLLAVDGSAHAREATRALSTLPLVRAAAVTVLGVDDGRHGREHGVRSAVDEAADALRAAGAGAVTTEVVGTGSRAAVPDARAVLLDLVDDRRPDLVVLGARGAGGLRGALLGSTASAMVHHAPCSVLLGRAEVTDGGG